MTSPLSIAENKHKYQFNEEEKKCGFTVMKITLKEGETLKPYYKKGNWFENKICGTNFEDGHYILFVRLTQEEVSYLETKLNKRKSAIAYMLKFKCPICKTSEDKEVVLIGIDGTQEGHNIQATQVHLECLELRITEPDLISNQRMIYQLLEDKK